MEEVGVELGNVWFDIGFGSYTDLVKDELLRETLSFCLRAKKSLLEPIKLIFSPLIWQNDARSTLCESAGEEFVLHQGWDW